MVKYGHGPGGKLFSAVWRGGGAGSLDINRDRPMFYEHGVHNIRTQLQRPTVRFHQAGVEPPDASHSLKL